MRVSQFGMQALWIPAGILFLAGCDEKMADPDMVTISGEVRSVDTGTLAEGVQVALLGTEFVDDVATGTDGKFSIQVPKGSPSLFVTDDFDPARADVWFPTLNVDHPPLTLNEDLSGWLIHSCPVTVGMEVGSVAAWDHYLANGDSANGDLFVPTNAASAGGILAMLILGGAAMEQTSSAGFTVTLDSPQFPVAYANVDSTFNAAGTPDPNLGPNMYYPATRTFTDIAGFVSSFGDPAFTGSSVMLTFVDTDSVRNMTWVSPIEVPMRPGMISLLLPCHYDGVENIRVADWTLSMGWR